MTFKFPTGHADGEAAGLLVVLRRALTDQLLSRPRSSTGVRPRIVKDRHAMSLKKAILDAVSDERLSALEDELDAARGRILNKLEAVELLPHLQMEEVQQAARSYRVPARGDREHIIEALLAAEAYRDSGSEPALYDDGPFAALFVSTATDNDRRPVAIGVQGIAVEGRSLSAEVSFKLRPEGGPWRVGRRPLFEEDLIGALEPAQAQAALDTLFDQAQFIAMHRAERAAQALERAGLALPPLPLQCTLVLSRRVFGEHQGTFAASRSAARVEREDDAGTALARIVLAAQRAVRHRCGR